MTRLKSEGGFSLIELVLVILILGVALLPLVTQMMESTVHGADGQAASTAGFLARERMEEVMADRAASAVGYTNILTSRYPAESPVTGFPGFTRTTVVSGDSTWSGMTYRAVDVTVTTPLTPPVTLTSWVVQ